MRVSLCAPLGRPIRGGGASMPETPNANLLLWSEEMQQAAWTKTGVTVSANASADPLGGMTADDCTFTATGTLAQSTSIAAATGATAGVSIEISASPAFRESISGIFDGVTYVLSVWVSTVSGGELYRLEILRSGGVLVARLRGLGDPATVTIWGWKLETPDLSDYVKREGT